MQELFANNAESTIADVGGITSTATTITLASGEGARFPAAVTGTSQFRAVLVDASTNAVLEYITVTNRSTDTLTVTRESEDATRFPKAARAQGVKVVDVITAAVLSLIGVPAGGTAGQVLGKSTSADYAQAWQTPGAGGGNYFRTGYYSLGTFASGSTGPLALTLNTVLYRPFLVPARRAFDRIGLRVATAGASGAVLRLGLYADGGGVPGTLVVDAGTVSSTTTGDKEATIAQTLSAGLYWIAVVAQSVACSVTAFPSSQGNPWFTQDPGVLQGLGLPAAVQASVSGALPSTAAVDVGSGSIMPLVSLRAA